MKKSYIIGAIVVVSAMVMALYSFRSTMTSYVSVSEAKVSSRPVQVAGVLVKGRGFGLVGDLIVGVFGALVGGLLFGLLGITAYGVIGSLLMSLVGAIVFLFLIGLIWRRPAPR